MGTKLVVLFSCYLVLISNYYYYYYYCYSVKKCWVHVSGVPSVNDKCSLRCTLCLVPLISIHTHFNSLQPLTQFLSVFQCGTFVSHALFFFLFVCFTISITASQSHNVFASTFVSHIAGTQRHYGDLSPIWWR